MKKMTTAMRNVRSHSLSCSRATGPSGDSESWESPVAQLASSNANRGSDAATRARLLVGLAGAFQDERNIYERPDTLGAVVPVDELEGYPRTRRPVRLIAFSIALAMVAAAISTLLRPAPRDEREIDRLPEFSLALLTGSGS